MIGLDTNVLLRFLLKDDGRQTERAARFISTACTAETPGYINHIVLCELAWVLQSTFRYPPASIAVVIEAICRTSRFRVEDMDAVREALDTFRDGKAGFADCLIGVLNRRAGCQATATFDGAAAALPEFHAI